MVKIHFSETKFNLLNKYDSLLISRKNLHEKYYLLFLFFYRDYFIYKLVNKLMYNGEKLIALHILRSSLLMLKNIIGFQPFFLFKHICFKMRQLFKIQKKVIRQSKTFYLPLLLKPHNQVTYGINHIIKCSKQLSLEEKKPIHICLCIILLNSFISHNNK